MTDETAAPREWPPRPAGSNAVLQVGQGEFVLDLPPLGVLNFKQVTGLIALFAVLFIAGGPMALWLHFGLGLLADRGPGEAIASAVVSVLIGAAVGAWAVWLGTRRTTFAVTTAELAIRRKSAFEQSRRTWPREEVALVRAARRQMGSPGKRTTLIELHIETRDGDVTRLFGERDADEIRWVAAVLRQALNLPDGADNAE